MMWWFECRCAHGNTFLHTCLPRLLDVSIIIEEMLYELIAV